MSITYGRGCQAVARAVLGAVDAPDGVLLKCGLNRGHEGWHRFLMEWGDPPASPGGLIADQISAYLNSRRDDPAFQTRIAERIAEDAEILRRLADESDQPDQQEASDE